jgi:hypothetical protein
MYITNKGTLNNASLICTEIYLYKQQALNIQCSANTWRHEYTVCMTYIPLDNTYIYMYIYILHIYIYYIHICIYIIIYILHAILYTIPIFSILFPAFFIIFPSPGRDLQEVLLMPSRSGQSSLQFHSESKNWDGKKRSYWDVEIQHDRTRSQASKNEEYVRMDNLIM